MNKHTLSVTDFQGLKGCGGDSPRRHGSPAIVAGHTPLGLAMALLLPLLSGLDLELRKVVNTQPLIPPADREYGTSPSSEIVPLERIKPIFMPKPGPYSGHRDSMLKTQGREDMPQVLKAIAVMIDLRGSKNSAYVFADIPKVSRSKDVPRLLRPELSECSGEPVKDRDNSTSLGLRPFISLISDSKLSTHKVNVFPMQALKGFRAAKAALERQKQEDLSGTSLLAGGRQERSDFISVVDDDVSSTWHFSKTNSCPRIASKVLLHLSRPCKPALYDGNLLPRRPVTDLPLRTNERLVLLEVIGRDLVERHYARELDKEVDLASDIRLLTWVNPFSNLRRDIFIPRSSDGGFLAQRQSGSAPRFHSDRRYCLYASEDVANYLAGPPQIHNGYRSTAKRDRLRSIVDGNWTWRCARTVSLRLSVGYRDRASIELRVALRPKLTHPTIKVALKNRLEGVKDLVRTQRHAHSRSIDHHVHEPSSMFAVDGKPASKTDAPRELESHEGLPMWDLPPALECYPPVVFVSGEAESPSGALLPQASALARLRYGPTENGERPGRIIAICHGNDKFVSTFCSELISPEIPPIPYAVEVRLHPSRGPPSLVAGHVDGGRR